MFKNPVSSLLRSLSRPSGSSSAIRSGLALLFAASALAACVTPGQSPRGGQADAPPPPSATSAAANEQAMARELSRVALTEANALYEAGDYSGAIRRLNTASPDLERADVPLRLEAFKIAAFSYCLTKRPASCREEFDKALVLDPNFDLTRAEKGHPIWGPVFERAKIDQLRKSRTGK